MEILGIVITALIIIHFIMLWLIWDFQKKIERLADSSMWWKERTKEQVKRLNSLEKYLQIEFVEDGSHYQKIKKDK